MILTELKGDGVSINRKYCKERSIWIIVAPKWSPIQNEDMILKYLKKEVKKPTRTAQEKATCVSEATWRLADQRKALRRRHTEYQQELRAETRIFQAALQEDRRRRVSKAGEDIEDLLVADHMREAWRNIHRCYQKAKEHPTPPTRKGTEQTSTLREDLYRWRPPEGKAIPILVKLARISDDNPEGEDISVAVRRLQTGRVGVTSGMRTKKPEDLSEGVNTGK